MCSPDKPMMLISSSHEKQTAIKPRASRETESFYINESQSGIKSPRRHLGAEHLLSTAIKPRASRETEFLTASVLLGCTRQPESRPVPSRKARPITRQESRPDQPLTAQRGWLMTCLTGRFQSQITSRFVARTWPGCCGGLSPANA